MPKSTEKSACGEPLPPDSTPVGPMPSSDLLNAILSKLDSIAMKLENSGQVRLAEEVDQVSNSIGFIKKS